jgi:FkbH-like protein
VNDEPTEHRQIVDDLIGEGQYSAAWSELRTHWQSDPGQSAAGCVLSRFEKIREHLPTTKFRVAILRSFTVEPMVPLLRAGAAVGGIDLEVRLGEFNAYPQELLDPGSFIYKEEPDVVILAVQTRDIAPELWREFTSLSEDDVDAAIDRVTSGYGKWLELFRSRSKASLVIHNLEQPPRVAHGILDAQLEHGQAESVRRLNRELAKTVRQFQGVYLLDYDGVIAEAGRHHWYDERKWLSVRLPVAADHLVRFSEAWLAFVHLLCGRTAKCLVCDLDNTLWGGVIGEDGMEGIQLGVEYPGAAYLELQRAILDLHKRGVILAICSKNNESDAMEALANHEHMLLRPEHFSAMRINWRDKAANLREIAAELNIGIDALAFLDDNPVECQLVRQQLPEVTVVELSQDPTGYAAAVRGQPVFQRLALSDEDQQRGKLYADQRERSDLQDAAGSLEEFYASLEQKLEFAGVDSATLPRVAQLTQKTNQFNMTTRRYTEADIQGFRDDPLCRAYSARVTDRFGDNGVIGVVVVKIENDAWVLDTFLMSCRVIGRTVETAILAAVVDQARAAKASRLIGDFISTKKNVPAGDVYAEHGFEKAGASTYEGGTRWELDLEEKVIETPAWIESEIL